MRSSAKGVVSGSTVKCECVSVSLHTGFYFNVIDFIFNVMYISKCLYSFIHSFIPFYFCRDASGSGEEGSSEFPLTKEKFSFFICVYNCLDFSLG